jgi:hypothetical protein
VSYLIIYRVPYEGASTQPCTSLEEVKDWLKENMRSYDYDLDSVEVIENPKYINVYELMKE